MVGSADSCNERTCSWEDGQEASGVLAVVGLACTSDSSITAREEDGYTSGAELSEEVAGTIICEKRGSSRRTSGTYALA